MGGMTMLDRSRQASGVASTCTLRWAHSDASWAPALSWRTTTGPGWLRARWKAPVGFEMETFAGHGENVAVGVVGGGFEGGAGAAADGQEVAPGRW